MYKLTIRANRYGRTDRHTIIIEALKIEPRTRKDFDKYIICSMFDMMLQEDLKTYLYFG